MKCRYRIAVRSHPAVNGKPMTVTACYVCVVFGQDMAVLTTKYCECELVKPNNERLPK